MISQARVLGYHPCLQSRLHLPGGWRKRPMTPEHPRKLKRSFSTRRRVSTRRGARRSRDRCLVYVVGDRKDISTMRSSGSIRHRGSSAAGGHELLHAWLVNNLGCAYAVHHHDTDWCQRPRAGIGSQTKTLGTRSSRRRPIRGKSRYVLEGWVETKRRFSHVQRRSQFTKALGPRHPDLANQLNNRGEILNALGKTNRGAPVVRAGHLNLGAGTRTEAAPILATR